MQGSCEDFFPVNSLNNLTISGYPGYPLDIPVGALEFLLELSARVKILEDMDIFDILCGL